MYGRDVLVYRKLSDIIEDVDLGQLQLLLDLADSPQNILVHQDKVVDLLLGFVEVLFLVKFEDRAPNAEKHAHARGKPMLGCFNRSALFNLADGGKQTERNIIAVGRLFFAGQEINGKILVKRILVGHDGKRRVVDLGIGR